MAPCKLKRIARSAGRRRIIPFVTQDYLEGIDYAGFVVDNKNPGFSHSYTNNPQHQRRHRRRWSWQHLTKSWNAPYRAGTNRQPRYISFYPTRTVENRSVFQDLRFPQEATYVPCSSIYWAEWRKPIEAMKSGNDQ